MNRVVIFITAVAAIAFLRDDQSSAVAEELITSAPPVSSLVSGLQARLAENPEDAKGWALLAQSYAFMGDGPRAEEAIANAVKLGVDEADLRIRIGLATQSPRTPIASERQLDWVQRAIADGAPSP